jgi:hypothetical protein
MMRREARGGGGDGGEERLMAVDVWGKMVLLLSSGECTGKKVI